jgi:hypothetical protein
MRRFRGNIVVECDRYIARFWLGVRAYLRRDEPDWIVGNVGIALDEVRHLEKLGHIVEVYHLGEED